MPNSGRLPHQITNRYTLDERVPQRPQPRCHPLKMGLTTTNIFFNYSSFLELLQLRQGHKEQNLCCSRTYTGQMLCMSPNLHRQQTSQQNHTEI